MLALVTFPGSKNLCGDFVEPKFLPYHVDDVLKANQ